MKLYPAVSPKFEITTTAKVSRSQVADSLCCAFEGGSNYWIDWVDQLPYILPHPPQVVLDPELRLPVQVREYDEPVALTLDEAAVRRGLQLMAEQYPEQFRQEFPADAEDYDGDAETADLFLQLCLFGELRYS